MLGGYQSLWSSTFLMLHFSFYHSGPREGLYSHVNMPATYFHLQRHQHLLRITWLVREPHTRLQSPLKLTCLGYWVKNWARHAFFYIYVKLNFSPSLCSQKVGSNAGSSRPLWESVFLGCLSWCLDCWGFPAQPMKMPIAPVAGRVGATWTSGNWRGHLHLCPAAL